MNWKKKLKAFRTSGVVQQEYANLCAQAGELGSKIEVSKRDLKTMHDRAEVLLTELFASRANETEQATKQKGDQRAQGEPKPLNA